MTRKLYRALLLLFLIVVTYLFAKEVNNHTIRIAHLDKVVHFGVFFALAFFSHRAFKFKIWFHMILLTSYGAAVEWMQSTLPYRQASLGDFIADVSGAMSYFIAIWLLDKYKQRRAAS
ncbi:VanZ family protein [Pseudoalteromonas luteoviolacea]|uniref:VanZ-like domain-containing protein n=1 Tax=Pseudoalteromonas luteoviolacea H33 TaxID=1365251 RepID=A0A161Y760_9GAMM|nr:VanZ family protein [Pseudoalteromonas luteoviolacea]KZN51435.1 hypothetical protein N476_13690 [Pseudoalteromonas luteoviolacea H33]KZN71394.1 hypothetical protein N477_03730 [Pseudoalteromonas luteoviolacea H33-S]MBQ4876751.1 VanZ family protein [Pseudoalteromonas luteoviolacea]MBQ4905460.1 VanZ family protein [Pseudoalteromonas luteoviolacea]